jgi:HSP20 family protein
MAIMRWDPFAEVDRMLDLMSRGAQSGGSGQTGVRGMAMDVYREGEKYVVEMDLPGVDTSSININVERNMLTVEAESHAQHEQADEVVVCERRHARFRRQLYLGENVETDDVQATYDNGVLRLEVPISTEQRARKIEVSTQSKPAQIGAQTGSGKTGDGGQQSSGKAQKTTSKRSS